MSRPGAGGVARGDARAVATRPEATNVRRPARRLRLALARALVIVALATAGSALATTYTYDVDRYDRFVSNGTWWTFASMTNRTAYAIAWRVSVTMRACTELSGAVSLGIAARIEPKRSSCSTATRTMSRTVAAMASAALLRREVLHYDFYLVRKIDRSSGRTVSTGYVTRKDSFTDYAFSSYR